MELTNNQKMGISLRGKVNGLNFFRYLSYVVILIIKFLGFTGKGGCYRFR